MNPNVIDISHWNTVRDFAALKAAGILGVILKCTQGTNYVDPTYVARRKLITDAGLLFGAYTFNTGENVKAQVEQFFSHAEPDDNTLMALDFEDNPHSQMSLDQARLFLQLADARLGRKLVLYSGNRIKDMLGNHADAFFGSHKLWLAQYGPVAKTQPSWLTPFLWQYSENGQLPGTDGKIDLNYYAGTNLKSEWVS